MGTAMEKKTIHHGPGKPPFNNKQMYYGGKKGMGVSPLIHLSPSPNHLHSGLWRAGADALKRRHHVREMETFHVVNPQGCQRNPNERGSCGEGGTQDCLGEESEGHAADGNLPLPLPADPVCSLERKQLRAP